MDVKELINSINTFNVKIVYDTQLETKNNLKNGKPLYFTPVEGKEKSVYHNKKNKGDFVSSTASIHIPNLSIEYLINIFECDGTGIHELIKNTINPYCNLGVPKDVVYVIFLFLHEVGHWQQFINLGKNVEKFSNLDIDARKDNFTKFNQLEQSRHERIKKGNDCPLTFNEKKLCQQYMQEYRDIPMEREADEFALSQMLEVLTLYKNQI